MNVASLITWLLHLDEAFACASSLSGFLFFHELFTVGSAAVRAACQDNDKVHIHGVRALGYLLAIHTPQGEPDGPGCVSNGGKPAGGGVEADAAHWWGQDWLAQGSQCLQTSLASRNEKVTLHTACM